MSLGIIVMRLGEFVGEQAPAEPQAAEPERIFPDALTHLRDAFGHHLVPLMLLARSDGEVAFVEREAVLRYCIDCARREGMAVSLAEQAALGDYLREFRPTRIQLNLALKRLERETKDRIEALIDAAQAVVDADGERRAGEIHFIEELRRDLAGL